MARTDRQTLCETVARVQVLDKAVLPRHAARWFDRSRPPPLVLVTCADWDGRRFLGNVVFARPAAS